MKTKKENNVDKELSFLISNLLSNKPITKKDIERIRKMKRENKNEKEK